MSQINKPFGDIVASREAAIDSEGFHMLSAIGRELATSRAGEAVFDPLLFTEKLVSVCVGGGVWVGGCGYVSECVWICVSVCVYVCIYVRMCACACGARERHQGLRVCSADDG